MTHPTHRPITAGRLAWRWATGLPLRDGIEHSDAEWFTAGSVSWRRSGRTSRWGYRPRSVRAAIRSGATLAALAAAVGYRVARVPTLAALAAVAVLAVAWATWRTWRAVRTATYRRTVARPLARALAPVVELPPVELGRRLALPGPRAVTGSSRVVVPLPDHWAGRAAQVADVGRIVAQRLGGEWDHATQTKARPFTLTYSPRPAPPGRVTFDMVRDAALATTQDRPVLGLGTRSEVVHMDFGTDQAHLGMSAGTGAGKSSFLRWTVAQFAHHGVRDFLVADVKLVSLQGMESVPGLRIVRDVPEIWDALGLAAAEMNMRYSQLLNDPTRTFPRKVIVLEEQNAYAMETAMIWREIRPKGDRRALAPVWGHTSALLLKGRAVNINLIGVYQRMDVASCGGGAYRDQYGLKLLSRHSPAAWDSLVATRPRVAASTVPGRAVAILGDRHRTVQLPFVTVEEALAFATSGPPVTVTPAGDPSPQVAPPGRGDVTDPTPRFTLADAARQDWCPVTYDALRQRASRGRAAGTWPDGDRWTRGELLAALGQVDRIDA